MSSGNDFDSCCPIKSDGSSTEPRSHYPSPRVYGQFLGRRRIEVGTWTPYITLWLRHWPAMLSLNAVLVVEDSSRTMCITFTSGHDIGTESVLSQPKDSCVCFGLWTLSRDCLGCKSPRVISFTVRYPIRYDNRVIMWKLLVFFLWRNDTEN